MGRKKIEIQPITHERNRSVTFLKRKNGLFKKAYELGVLCSVDVAVIIFEERPGHHVKLYQYCSADINDMVQRHLRHDGEKDHKGPADFSGNANPKVDEIGDENDDDGDDDDEVPSRNKRGRDGKLKPPQDMHVAGMDYSHRSLAIPQAPPLSMHGIGPQNTGPGLSISSDRLSNIRNSAKRGRLEIHPHSRSPSDDPSNGSSYYHPHSSATPFAPARQSGYHSSHHQSNPQYTPFFSPQSGPSFIQNAGLSRAGPGYGLSHHAGSSGSASYDSAPIYPSIMGRTGSTTLTSSTSAGSSGGNLFPPFLDAADEQGRHQQHSQAQQSGFGSLDWPVHTSGNSGSSGAHSSLPESIPNPQPATAESGGQGSNSHWLDFLSTSNNASSASTAREVMSWERGGGSTSNNSELYVERRPGTAGSPLMAGMVNAGKRSPGGLLTSPLSGVNGRDNSNKEIPPG